MGDPARAGYAQPLLYIASLLPVLRGPVGSQVWLSASVLASGNEVEILLGAAASSGGKRRPR